MMKYTDFFELINNEGRKPVAALFMTYGFNAELFEHHVLPGFLGILADPFEEENKFRFEMASKLKEVPVAVISDGLQFNGGRTFLQYDHITVKEETFHPKCYLLLYKEYLRVIIASANITKAGLCYNAELLWHEDIYLEEESSISKELLSILEFLKGRHSLENIGAVNEVIKYLKRVKFKNTFPKVIASSDSKSPLNHVLSEINKVDSYCTTITILSPFFESDRRKSIESSLIISFCNKLTSLYPKVKIKVIFPAVFNEESNKYKVNVPADIFKKLESSLDNVNFYVLLGEWQKDEDETVIRELHGKLIYAEFVNKFNLYLSGSINFTNNAMKSNNKNLRNFEVGVLNFTKSKLSLPNIKKVKISQLLVKEQEESAEKEIYFVEEAVLLNKELSITFNKKALLPFKLFYEDKEIYQGENFKETVVISNFKLKRCQEIKVSYGEDKSFYVPIFVLNKEELITEDLKYINNYNLKDVIDFLSGKYKSVSEIDKMKSLNSGFMENSMSEVIIYFRQDLQRFYKAVSALQKSLERKFYSKSAFIYCVNDVFGIKKLLRLIIDEYNDSTKQETFLFLVEIINIVEHLNYPEDWFPKKDKIEILEEITLEAKSIVKSIVKKSKGKVRKQYEVIIDSYGLEECL